MHTSRSSCEWISTAVALALICCAAIGCAHPDSSPATRPVTDGKLTIRPMPAMLDYLNIPLDDQLIGVFRCDFLTEALDSVELKMVAVKDHELSELGELAIETRRFDQKELRGTFSIAFMSPSGGPANLTQLISLGISTEDSQKHRPVTKFKIDPEFQFKIAAMPAECLVEPGRETLIWGVSYKRKGTSERQMTLQELTAHQAPFNVDDPARIIESAKLMDDVVVILVTAKGLKRGMRI